MAAVIDRAFLRLPEGLTHYRSAGACVEVGSPPLYMAHSGPGSSLGLACLIAELGESRRVIAPDMMGNGDSDPPPKTDMKISDYVALALAVLDRLGLERVDLYGSHTGANIVCELAIRHPDRVRRVILDGVGLYEQSLQAKLLDRYAPPVRPDEHGGHLAWAWHWITELYWHFPYFERDPAHRLNAKPVRSAADRQDLAVDLIKALSTYHIAYQAAFRHPIAERLPALTAQTLILAVAEDPLAIYAPAAAALVPNAALINIAYDGKTAAIQAFLDA